MPTSLRERFEKKVIRTPPGCWLWSAGKNSDGYGSFHLRVEAGRTISERAHRVAWMLEHGEIPPGRHVLHHCDNPPCVNPAHLFLGSHSDNMRDMARKGRVGGARLGYKQADEMRRLYWVQGKSSPALSGEFGVEQTQVSKILRNRAWPTQYGADMLKARLCLRCGSSISHRSIDARTCSDLCQTILWQHRNRERYNARQRAGRARRKQMQIADVERRARRA